MVKRFNVIGTSGSGKSTFSRKLAELLSIELVEMDALFWGENWCPVEDELFLSRIKVATERDSWVLDGNYNKTVPLKWKNVEAVIWIDYSFIRTMYQAIGRAFNRAITQKEFWPGTGNRESFKRSLFSKDSILLWTLKTYHKNRKRYLAVMKDDQYSHINFIRLTSPKKCEDYLMTINSKD